MLPISGAIFEANHPEEELNRLEARAATPDFWKDQAEAQKVQQRRRRLEQDRDLILSLKKKSDDLSVLLEWALESLTKNAIDALAGRDGRVEISAESLPEGRVRIRVSDDGPGIPREIRHQIFDPGFSTKEKGWGIGLSLARRIVRDSHGGELSLVPSERGATFDMVLG